jgi:general secretion pathway protein G
MRSRRLARARTGGFTLIEFVVAIGLLALLASVAMPVAELAWQREREAQLRASLRELRAAIDAYKQATDAGLIARSPEQTGYPPSLAVLVEGVRNQRDAKGAPLVFLRRIPRDPFHADPSIPPERTWALRAYGTPPGDTRGGTDVFDVQSTSERVGLNGVPLRQW